MSIDSNRKYAILIDKRILEPSKLMFMKESLWLFGTPLSILADETQTSSLYDLIEGTFASGVETALHVHSKYSELIFVLKGEFTIYTNEETVILRPGKSHFIPKGTPHMVSASSADPSTAFTIASPSGFAEVIRLFGTVDPTKDVIDPKTIRSRTLKYFPSLGILKPFFKATFKVLFCNKNNITTPANENSNIIGSAAFKFTCFSTNSRRKSG